MRKNLPCKISLSHYYLFFFLSRSPNTKPAINKWFPISKQWIVIVIWLCFRSDILIKRKIKLSKIEFSCSLLQGQFNLEHLRRKAKICRTLPVQNNNFRFWELDEKNLAVVSKISLWLLYRKEDLFTENSCHLCAWEFCKLNNKQSKRTKIYKICYALS